jgi:hypothetical protein
VDALVVRIEMTYGCNFTANEKVLNIDYLGCDANPGCGSSPKSRLAYGAFYFIAFKAPHHQSALSS